MKIISNDFKGRKINFLTILKKCNENQEDIRRGKWLCRCECGKQLKIRTEQLNKGQKSCGCKKRTLDLSNKIFGQLKVIKRVPNPFGHDALWLCICACGKEKTYTSSHLRKGLSKSCGCLKYKGYKDISHTFFNRIRHSAILRKIEFRITLKEIWDLFIKQKKCCALSGLSLKFPSNTYTSDGTASLDRIDSSQGYTIDNVQWVHKDINYMKQDNTDQEFITYCKLVASYNK